MSKSARSPLSLRDIPSTAVGVIPSSRRIGKRLDFWTVRADRLKAVKLWFPGTRWVDLR